MCPGGFIVPAATGPDEIVLNGMSPSGRNSKFANSGMVVEIKVEDFPLIVKPNEGRGSVGIHSVNSFEELENAIDDVNDLMDGGSGAAITRLKPGELQTIRFESTFSLSAQANIAAVDIEYLIIED